MTKKRNVGTRDELEFVFKDCILVPIPTFPFVNTNSEQTKKILLEVINRGLNVFHVEFDHFIFDYNVGFAFDRSMVIQLENKEQLNVIEDLLDEMDEYCIKHVTVIPK